MQPPFAMFFKVIFKAILQLPRAISLLEDFIGVRIGIKEKIKEEFKNGVTINIYNSY